MRKVLSFVLLIQFSCSESQSKIQNNPQAVELNIKGLDYLIKSEYDTAILIFNQAIAIDSSFDLPHRNKFRIFFKQKDFKQALIESEALIKLNPDRAEWWLNGGMILDQIGEGEKAKNHYLEALDIIEKDLKKRSEKDHKGELLLAKGLTLILLEEEEKGRNLIQTLLKANPGNEQIKDFATISKAEYLANVLDKQIYFNKEND